MAAKHILAFLLWHFMEYSIVSAACGGLIKATTNEQKITPPVYARFLRCQWTIQPSAPDMDIQLSLSTNLNSFGSGSICTGDSVSIYTGVISSQNLFATRCGRMKQTMQLRGDRNITVVFRTNYYYGTNKGGMVLKFRQSREGFPCSETFSSSSQKSYALSGLYPKGYQSNKTCLWRFTKTTRTGKHHVLKFIGNSNSAWDCSTQYVYIYKGVSDSGKMIGKYCGTGSPVFIGSGSMFVKHVTGRNPVESGFKIQHYTTSGIFAHTKFAYTYRTGYISTPNYPYSMPSNVQCTYKISVSSSYVVKVTFLTSDLGPYCYKNMVNVLDGANKHSRSVGIVCGSQTTTYRSTGRYIFVEFITGDLPSGTGFNMSYKAVRAPSTTVLATTPSYTSSCGTSALTAWTYGSFLSSPGYPNSYPPYKKCTWTITTADITKVVRIQVLTSKLQNGCSDYVKVFDGSSIYSSQLAIWCGDMTPTVQSTGHQMTLQFSTNGFFQYKGFRLKYFQTSAEEFGGTLTANSFSKELTSPNYPLNYDNNLDCVWKINAPYHLYIKIKVTDSNLEYSSRCTDDYVKIYDGTSIYSSLLGSFCGSNTPTYVSSGDDVTIKFHSDSSGRYKGFKLTYEGTSSSVTSGHSGRTRVNVGAIVGGIFGSIIIIIIVIVVVVIAARRPTNARPTTTTRAYPQMTYGLSQNTATVNGQYPPNIYQGQYASNVQFQPNLHAYNNAAYSGEVPGHGFDKLDYSTPPPAYETVVSGAGNDTRATEGTQDSSTGHYETISNHI